MVLAFVFLLVFVLYNPPYFLIVLTRGIMVAFVRFVGKVIKFTSFPPMSLRVLFPKGNNFQRDEIKGSESYIIQLFCVHQSLPIASR